MLKKLLFTLFQIILTAQVQMRRRL